MSEPKRVSFQTITSTTATMASGTSGFAATSSTMSSIRFGYNLFGDEAATANNDGTPGSTSQDNKTDCDRTFRLKLKLFQTDSSNYPEFNYSKLLHLEKKKVKKLKQKTNGFVDPFGSNDDDVERIAKELERKYSGAYGGGGGRSRNRKDEKSDLGLGYDITDSFIDNTEAYDEILPEEMEAKEGGFYINSGALVFKSLYNEPVKTKTDEIIKMPNRPKKRVLSSSSEESSSDGEHDDDDDDDDDNDDDENDDDEDDDTEEEEDVTTESSKNKTTIQKEKRIKQDSTISKKSQDTDKKRDNKKGIQSQSCSLSNSPKPSVASVEEGCSDSDKDRMRQQKTVKTTTVKDMLKAKRDNFLKMQEGGGGDTKNVNGELKGSVSKSSDDDSSDDESDDGDDNSDSNQSAPTQGKDGKRNPNEDGAEKLRTSETKLPELESDIAISIQDFKDMAKTNNLIGKRFQFDDHLTDVFLKIDESLLCIERSQRNMVFAHLEFELLLPKYYFLRKAKQLRIKEEKMKSKRALGKLRKAVIETMPGAIAGYEVELRKTTESQSGNLHAEQLPKMPKKKFPWDSNLRNLLYDVYQVRWTSYPVLRTRKETLEDFINIFMRDKVVELWPSGWMRYEELQKEIERRKAATKKAKEKKKHISSANVTSNATGIVVGTGDGISATADVPYAKQDESVSSGRSCANSDTDSVASSGNSGALKRKAADSNQKQSKNKSQKYSNEKLPPSVNGDPNTMPLGRMSPASKTDQGMYHPVAVTDTNTTTTTTNAFSNAGASNTAASDASTKHSIMARPYAHVIDLDKYKSTNDILQTSKKMLHTVSTSGPIGGYSNALDNSNIRRSSSDSDGVEIVGVFQAEPVLPAAATIAANMSKQKHKRNGSRGLPPSTSGNNFPLDTQSNLYTTQSSSSSSGAAAAAASIFMKTCPTTNINMNNNNNINNNNNNNSNTINNHKRSASLSLNSSAGGVNNNIATKVANFDTTNVLKELDIPQSVSAKSHNQ